jgi:hypothetical protein
MNNRITVVKPDSCVVVDGNGQFNIDLTFLASNIRVVQWYSTYGEVEYSDGTYNLAIDDFSPYMQAYNNWNTAYQANTDRPDTYYLKSNWRESRKYKLNETPDLILYTILTPILGEDFQKFENGIWIVDTDAKRQNTIQQNKNKAKSLIAQYDWINDTTTTPKLLNKDDFYAYRSALRLLILNPVENPVWPEIPQEVWDAN